MGRRDQERPILFPLGKADEEPRARPRLLSTRSLPPRMCSGLMGLRY